MSEEQGTSQGASQGTEQNQSPAGTTSTPDFSEAVEKGKREIAGLNRKISELEKVIKDKDLEKLSEVEREKKEAELARQEKEKLLAENEKIKLDRIKDIELLNAGIPPEFAKRINGDDEDSIKKDVNDFKAFIDKLVKEKSDAEISKQLGGKPPIAGASPQGKHITESEWNAMSPKEQSKFMASGGSIQG